MTIENSLTIDAIGTDEATGTVHLSIFAHLPWNRSALLLLQEKTNRYLGFIEAGELIQAYPSARGLHVVIDCCLSLKTDPVRAAISI
jgi:hypothetical protein